MKAGAFEKTAMMVVVVVVAVMTWYLHRPAAAVKLAPQVEAPTVGMRAAPPFTLEDLEGHPFTYPGKQGPAFIILSAVGCQDCRQRVPRDHEALARAHARNVPVWNMLVYANRESGAEFVRSTGQKADLFLVDDGRVAVGAYGGNDAMCWIVIDDKGMIVWQGGGDLSRLDQALKSVISLPSLVR